MNTKYKVLSVVSLVVGLIALVTAFSNYNQPAPAAESLGGVYANNSVASGAGGGIDFGPVPVNVNWQGGKIGPKANQGYYRNVSGATQYAENVEVSTDGIASSSYKFYAYATTTAPRTLYDFTAPTNNVTTSILINGFSIATSSVATTTSSDDTKGGSGPFAGSVAQIPNGGYLIVVMQSASSPSACSSSGGICESATSTNRGFNVPWRVLVHN